MNYRRSGNLAGLSEMGESLRQRSATSESSRYAIVQSRVNDINRQTCSSTNRPAHRQAVLPIQRAQPPHHTPTPKGANKENPAIWKRCRRFFGRFPLMGRTVSRRTEAPVALVCQKGLKWPECPHRLPPRIGANRFQARENSRKLAKTRGFSGFLEVSRQCNASWRGETRRPHGRLPIGAWPGPAALEALMRIIRAATNGQTGQIAKNGARASPEIERNS